jgi:hypothetical protein
MTQSVRAQVIERRTYLRPTDKNGTKFETPEESWRRVIAHQRWLWERAQHAPLSAEQEAELEELYNLFIDRKVTVSGRTRWLGGTAIAKEREASQFNCSFSVVQTVHDVVDTIWLLLQGCGVGFSANIGVLNGFSTEIAELEIIRSQKVLPVDADGNPVSDPALKGNPNNVETFNKETGVWRIVVGDSAEAWAKFFGKLLAFKGRAKKLIVDLSEIRPAGYRLSGYGWISSGDTQITKAVEGIFVVMNRAAGRLLTAIDLLDIENHLGTILSSRRSAEIALYEYGGPEWEEFATAKKDHYLYPDRKHRSMSNNSLVFYQKPTRRQLKNIFKLMQEAGGSEPGFINGAEARRRAPYFKGVNPCLTADAWIETDHGPRRVEELIDTPFNASVNGSSYTSTGFWKTGDKEVFRLTTSRGYEVRATADHRILVEVERAQKKSGGYAVRHEWVELKDLEPGDKVVLDDRSWVPMDNVDQDQFDAGWLLGEIVGDGGYNPDKYPTYVRFWGDSAEDLSEIAAGIVRRVLNPSTQFNGPVYNEHHGTWQVTCKALGGLAAGYIVPGTKIGTDELEKASLSFVAGYLRGLFDADGSVQGTLEKGVSIRLDQAHLERLEQVQRMLLRLGVASTIYTERQQEGFRDLPNGLGENNLYWCKESNTLVVSKSNVYRFAEVVGFHEPHKKARLEEILGGRTRAPYRERFTAEVVSIISEGVEAVYDATVDEVHRFVANGVVVHNCAEILLGDKSFCNLVETAVCRFNGDEEALHRAHHLVARANYRQTCVNLDDGVLQRTWHELNDFLRLCGVGVTGVVGWEHAEDAEAWQELRAVAKDGANGMADELHMPRPKLVTTLKPSGTQTKVFGRIGDEIGEGVHKPLGRYIFNNVNFSKDDPLVRILGDAGYHVMVNPYDDTGRIVRLPVEFSNMKFDKVTKTLRGKQVEVEVNLESAVAQLDRYRLLQKNYVDHNCSITVSYSPDEVPDIIDWLLDNWDDYIGVSFLYRTDPTKTAEELGYPYLPQEVVDAETFHNYVAGLLPVDLSGTDNGEMVQIEDCVTGACPIR